MAAVVALGVAGAGAGVAAVYSVYIHIKAWYASIGQCTAFFHFHDKHAPVSTEKMRAAVAKNLSYMVEIHKILLPICHMIRKLDNLSVSNGADGDDCSKDDDIHFEALVVIPVDDCGLEVIKADDKLDCIWMKIPDSMSSNHMYQVRTYWNVNPRNPDDTHVDSSKTVDLLLKQMEECVSSSQLMKGKVKLRRSPTAIQVDVHEGGFWGLSFGSRLFTLEMIPVYQIGGKLYVAKPPKSEMINSMTWWRCFLLKEAEKLCYGSRQVVRVLKALRNREPILHILTYHQLKTVVFYVKDDSQEWTAGRFMWPRLMDALLRLEGFLMARRMPDYFSPKIDLLSGIPEEAIARARERIHKLRTNTEEMLKILNA